MNTEHRNPLLVDSELPAFSHIRPRHIEPALDTILEENRASIAILAEDPAPTWEQTLLPLEELADRLSRAWSPVAHLHSVADNEDLRICYNRCLEKISAYWTELGQNDAIYRAYRQVAENEAETLSPAAAKIIANALRDFRLSGVELPAVEKQRFRDIRQRLSQLQTRFEENLLDATQAWTRHVSDIDELAGLPESALALARQTAADRGLDGWLLTLEMPSYQPVMAYADRRELRREIYAAFVTRASDQGPDAGRWDNGPLMHEILALRQEIAGLLGFANYSEYSLATKMAADTGEVLDFLEDLARRSRPMAEQEIAELRAFAHAQGGPEALEAWDLPYYAEKLRQHKHAISQEDLRPYFPAPRVIAGMFAVVQRLYGLDISAVKGIETWHDDVGFYEIRGADGQLRGSFYTDLYARAHKRGGAWMDECRIRKHYGDISQTPVAYLTCNFTPPVAGQPALLTHNEVTTLFHEFGHGLHHMLTQVDFPSVSGINGVPWDAVELPSQFMENWCWEREAIDLFSGHHQSGETLPDEMLARMSAARNFQSGMFMLRQLELALFDFRLHMQYRPEPATDVQALLDQVRAEVAVVRPPAFNRFQHGFSHIFAGGYAAGYYSYKWAEVLSADAFSRFEEQGIFDQRSGREFMRAILEQGGAREPMDLFIEFRGRKPSIEALLRHSGIAA